MGKVKAMEKATHKVVKVMSTRVIRGKVRAETTGLADQALTEAAYWECSAATVTTGAQALHCHPEYKRTSPEGSLFLQASPRNLMVDCWADFHITTATNGSRQART